MEPRKLSLRSGLALGLSGLGLFGLCTSALVGQPPEDVESLAAEAISLESDGRLEGAVERWSQVIEQAPENAGAYVRRAEAFFKLARIDASLADFDRAVELDASAEPYLWQRGITQFYAGEYEACRRQFELHRTVNPNDVENAAWHFLCVARDESPGVAQASLLPVGPDSRMPLRTIYELYRGRSTPEEVMGVARTASPERVESAHFYGELYIGLYHYVLGREEEGLQALRAASERDFPHYMRDVAKVHVRLATTP